MLAYEGPWLLEGKTRFVEPTVAYQGAGRASGRVWMDTETGLLQKHRFEWSRLVTVQGASAVQQQQSFQGSVERIQ